MNATRELQTVPIPAGEAVLEILPALRRALEGAGPALLPVPADDPSTASRLSAALDAGTRLAAGEDDPVDPTALVVGTSGSTGTPKGVLLPGSALRASATATHARLGGAGRWLLAMPAQHIAGIQVLVRSILAGTTPGVLDATAGFTPEAFAAAAEPVLDAPGRHYTALVPTQLARLLADGGDGLAALRRFDAVLLGGAATPPHALAAAAEHGVRVRTTYGMSETAGGCVYDGVALDGVRVHLDGPDSTGPIHLAGPVLARGYRGHTGDAESAFAGGWFRTGDLGRFDEDGRLEVLGRSDDMIISGGVNVGPALVERILAAQPGVSEVCVLGVPEAEWGEVVAAAIVPSDPAAAPDTDRLREAVREQAGAAAIPKRVTFAAELPLRGPGKPDRSALRDWFASRAT